MLPDQSPEAVQLVAFVLDQVSVELPPDCTFVGFAVRVTVGAGGAGVTVTSTLSSPVPFAPVMEEFVVPHQADVYEAIMRTVGRNGS